MKHFIVLVGPSASGKTSIGMGLREKMGAVEAISHTTRCPRVGEVEGDPYYYISKEQFDAIDKVEFTEYAGNFYCLSAKEMEEKLAGDKPLYVITDVHGLSALRERYGKSVYAVFVKVDPGIIEDRMRKRGDSEENIQKRLDKAVADKEFDNWEYCDAVVDNNGDLDTSIAIVESIFRKLNANA